MPPPFVLAHVGLFILLFVSIIVIRAICVLERRLDRKLSWAVASGYVACGILLAWGIPALNQFYKEYSDGMFVVFMNQAEGRKMPMLTLAKVLVSLHPAIYFAPFASIGIFIMLKVRNWPWRHRHLAFVLLLLAAVGSILFAVLYPVNYLPTSFIH